MTRRKISKSEKLLFLTPLLLLLTPLVLYVSWQDTLDKRMQAVAEPNAIDCGRIPAWQHGSSTTESIVACAVASAKAGKPFKYREDWPDGYRAHAVIGTSDRKLTKIFYTWRKRFGIKDWELIQVYRGNSVIGLKNGHEAVDIKNAKPIH